MIDTDLTVFDDEVDDDEDEFGNVTFNICNIGMIPKCDETQTISVIGRYGPLHVNVFLVDGFIAISSPICISVSNARAYCAIISNLRVFS